MVRTDHVLPHVSHGVELLLTDLTGELLLCVAMDDLVVFMQGPQLLEGLAARHTLEGEPESETISGPSGCYQTVTSESTNHSH